MTRRVADVDVLLDDYAPEIVAEDYYGWLYGHPPTAPHDATQSSAHVDTRVTDLMIAYGAAIVGNGRISDRALTQNGSLDGNPYPLLPLPSSYTIHSKSCPLGRSGPVVNGYQCCPAYNEHIGDAWNAAAAADVEGQGWWDLPTDATYDPIPLTTLESENYSVIPPDTP